MGRNNLERAATTRSFIKMLALLLVISATSATEIRVALFLSGVETSILGRRLLPAFEIAEETISHRMEIGETFNFTLLVFRSSTGCEYPIKSAVGVAARLFFQEGVVSFFGPACSSSLLAVGDLAASLSIPVFSGSACSHDLDDKTRFPTLTQTVYKPLTMVSFLNKIFDKYLWSNYVLIHEAVDVFDLAGDAIADGLRKAGKRSYIRYVTGDDDFDTVLEEASVVSQSKYLLRPWSNA